MASGAPPAVPFPLGKEPARQRSGTPWLLRVLTVRSLSVHPLCLRPRAAVRRTQAATAHSTAAQALRGCDIPSGTARSVQEPGAGIGSTPL